VSKECIITLNKYFYSGSSIKFFCKREVANEIAHLFSSRIQYIDRPDMIVMQDDMCLAVEHFEFDCYKKGRGGSKSKKEQDRIFRSVQQSTVDADKKIYDEIKGESSYLNYINNVKNAFTNHYLKIPEYKKNLTNKGYINADTKVKFAFLIEDVSPLGSSVFSDDSGLQPVILAFCKEFLELMRRSPNVDYVISCSQINSNKYIWLITNEEINKYEENIINYANLTFIDYKPQVLGY